MRVRGSTSKVAMSTFLAGVVAVTALAGCADDTPDDGDGDTDTGRSVVVEGLDRPTQLADGPDGTVVVAQLAGDEGEGTGQVLSFDPRSGALDVVLDGLDKPTGVLWQDGVVWVMVRRGLVRAAWDGSQPAGRVEVVLDDLPFNGRSEGTLTSLGDGRFLYETSGSITGGEVTAGSGTLWAFDPTTLTSTVVATGLKGGYAHAVLRDGRVLVSEIGDVAGPQPVEELNVIPMPGPSDLGWPDCPGDQVCEGVVSPLATFPPQSTPTGVAVVGGSAYVALFVSGRVMAVPMAGGEPTVVAEGLEGPHSLLVRDGALWLTEHLTGRVLELAPGD